MADNDPPLVPISDGDLAACMNSCQVINVKSFANRSVESVTLPYDISRFDIVDKRVVNYVRNVEVGHIYQPGESVDVEIDGLMWPMVLLDRQLKTGVIVGGELVVSDGNSDSAKSVEEYVWTGKWAQHPSYRKRFFVEKKMRLHIPDKTVQLPSFLSRYGRYADINKSPTLTPPLSLQTVASMGDSVGCHRDVVVNDVALSMFRDSTGETFSYLKVLKINTSSEVKPSKKGPAVPVKKRAKKRTKKALPPQQTVPEKQSCIAKHLRPLQTTKVTASGDGDVTMLKRVRPKRSYEQRVVQITGGCVVAGRDPHFRKMVPQKDKSGDKIKSQCSKLSHVPTIMPSAPTITLSPAAPAATQSSVVSDVQDKLDDKMQPTAPTITLSPAAPAATQSSVVSDVQDKLDDKAQPTAPTITLSPAAPAATQSSVVSDVQAADSADITPAVDDEEDFGDESPLHYVSEEYDSDGNEIGAEERVEEPQPVRRIFGFGFEGGRDDNTQETELTAVPLKPVEHISGNGFEGGRDDNTLQTELTAVPLKPATSHHLVERTAVGEKVEKAARVVKQLHFPTRNSGDKPVVHGRSSLLTSVDSGSRLRKSPKAAAEVKELAQGVVGPSKSLSFTEYRTPTKVTTSDKSAATSAPATATPRNVWSAIKPSPEKLHMIQERRRVEDSAAKFKYTGPVNKSASNSVTGVTWKKRHMSQFSLEVKDYGVGLPMEIRFKQDFVDVEDGLREACAAQLPPVTKDSTAAFVGEVAKVYIERFFNRVIMHEGRAIILPDKPTVKRNASLVTSLIDLQPQPLREAFRCFIEDFGLATLRDQPRVVNGMCLVARTYQTRWRTNKLELAAKLRQRSE